MSLPDQQRAGDGDRPAGRRDAHLVRAARRDLRVQDQEGRRPRVPRLHHAAGAPSSIATRSSASTAGSRRRSTWMSSRLRARLDAPVLEGERHGDRVRREDAAVRPGRPAVARARSRRADARARGRDRRRRGVVPRPDGRGPTPETPFGRPAGRPRARCGRTSSRCGEAIGDAGDRAQLERSRPGPKPKASDARAGVRTAEPETGSSANATATFTSATSRSSTGG